MSIGSRIKAARKEKKLTQDQLAQQCGVTKSAISNYENDVSTPDVEKLSAIMECLGVDPNYIYQDYYLSPSPIQKFFLTSDEQHLIALFRAASESDQAAIRMILSKYDTSAAPSRDAQTG